MTVCDAHTAAIFYDDKSYGRKRFALTKGRFGPKKGREGEGRDERGNVTTKELSGNYLCVIDADVACVWVSRALELDRC